MKIRWRVLIPCLLTLLFIGGTAHAAVGLPTLDIRLGESSTPESLSKGIQLLLLLTVLTLAPALIVMTTSFTRIIIVLSFVRQAMGLGQMPPGQIISGLALILTFFVMTPTYTAANEQGLQPYLRHEISQDVAFKRGIEPIRNFMFKQTGPKDLDLFIDLAKINKPRTTADVPTYVLLPSFVISELKTAFQLGFIIFLPFLVIDVVVSSILVSMGMMFLPPMSVSMPFKIILFVLMDGWHLVCQALVTGYQ